MLDRALSANKFAAIAAMPVCRSAPITEHIDSQVSVVERLREWSDWLPCNCVGQAANMFKWKPYFDTMTATPHHNPELHIGLQKTIHANWYL